MEDRTSERSSRPLLTAEVLSIGSELTVGETRDTNSGELARSMTELGLVVRALTALPDRLDDVRSAVIAAVDRSDLVVTTGGLGPTPDDLTREAIAEAFGEQPHVDPELEVWLRRLFERRHIPFPEANLKQAWLIPSARAIPNPHGTAPGWFVERADGHLVVALPGPPREMRPLWRDWVIPELTKRGAGRSEIRRTYRLAGIGESLVADMIGETLLRSANPVVATYARADAVDVRIAAVDEPGVEAGDGRPAAELFAEAESAVLAAVGAYVWGHDDDSWPQAIGRALDEAGWNLSTVEIGTAGALTNLLGGESWLRFAEVVAPDHLVDGSVAAAYADLAALADAVARAGRSQVGVALRARERGGDLAVQIAIHSPRGTRTERRTAFLSGPLGQTRAALAAASVLLDTLREAHRGTEGAAKVGAAETDGSASSVAASSGGIGQPIERRSS